MFAELDSAVQALTRSADAEADRVFLKLREANLPELEEACVSEADTTELYKSVHALLSQHLVLNQAMFTATQEQQYKNFSDQIQKQIDTNDRSLEAIKTSLNLLSQVSEITDQFIALVTRYVSADLNKQERQENEPSKETISQLLEQYKAAHESIKESAPYIALLKLFEDGQFKQENLADLQTLVQNAKEDHQGAVRVFVRIRAGVKTNAFSPTNLGDTVCVPNSEAKLCGELVCDQAHIPASQIFLPKATTEGIFTHTDDHQKESIKALCERLAEGNMGNLVLFGYGYSGSGKTYTLLGDEKQDGLFQLATKFIADKRKKEDAIVFVCQECYLEDPDRTRFDVIRDAQGRVQETKQILQTRKQVYTYTVDRESIKPINEIKAVNLSYSEQTDFNKLMKNVKRWRKNTFRVKWTPNNSESSRSHLLFRAKFTANNGMPRELAVLDLAGLEDSNFIFDNMIQEYTTGGDDCNIKIDKNTAGNREKWWDKKTPLTARGNSGGNTFRESYKTKLINAVMVEHKNTLSNLKQGQQIGCTRFDLKDKKELYSSDLTQLLRLNLQSDRYRYIWQLIDEGFFINKTISELADYLEDMKVNPRPIKNPRNFGTTGFCNLLDQLRPDGKHPAKFIMICTINAEQQNNARDNCRTDIADTIKFLKSIQKERHEQEEKKDAE